MKTSQNLQIFYHTIPLHHFCCETVYVKDYQIWLRAGNYLKLLALTATTSEQLVSIPGDAIQFNEILIYLHFADDTILSMDRYLRFVLFSKIWLDPSNRLISLKISALMKEWYPIWCPRATDQELLVRVGKAAKMGRLQQCICTPRCHPHWSNESLTKITRGVIILWQRMWLCTRTISDGMVWPF